MTQLINFVFLFNTFIFCRHLSGVLHLDRLLCLPVSLQTRQAPDWSRLQTGQALCLSQSWADTKGSGKLQ